VPRADGTKGGRPDFDHVLIFKILLVQAMHGLPDERCEYLIEDRTASRLADDHDRLRVPADPARRRGEGGNAPPDLRLSSAFPPSGAPCSSICSGHGADDVSIAAEASPSEPQPLRQISANHADCSEFTNRYDYIFCFFIWMFLESAFEKNT
jgi:hypothetical protein